MYHAVQRFLCTMQYRGSYVPCNTEVPMYHEVWNLKKITKISFIILFYAYPELVPFFS